MRDFIVDSETLGDVVWPPPTNSTVVGVQVTFERHASHAWATTVVDDPSQIGILLGSKLHPIERTRLACSTGGQAYTFN